MLVELNRGIGLVVAVNALTFAQKSKKVVHPPRFTTARELNRGEPNAFKVSILPYIEHLATLVFTGPTMNIISSPAVVNYLLSKIMSSYSNSHGWT